MYKAWKDEEAALTKKRETKAKLELSHKTDKISAITHEITEVSYPESYFIFIVAFIAYLSGGSGYCYCIIPRSYVTMGHHLK